MQKITFDEMPEAITEIRDNVRILFELYQAKQEATPKNEFISPVKLATENNIPLATIRKWIFERRFKTSKAGKHVMILRSDFDAYVLSKVRG